MTVISSNSTGLAVGDSYNYSLVASPDAIVADSHMLWNFNSLLQHCNSLLKFTTAGDKCSCRKYFHVWATVEFQHKSFGPKGRNETLSFHF